MLSAATSVLTFGCAASSHPDAWDWAYATALSSVWFAPVPFVALAILAGFHLGPEEGTALSIYAFWISALLGYCLTRLFPTYSTRFFRETAPKWLPHRLRLRRFPVTVSVTADFRISLRSKIAFQGLYCIPFAWFLLNIILAFRPRSTSFSERSIGSPRPPSLKDPFLCARRVHDPADLRARSTSCQLLSALRAPPRRRAQKELSMKSETIKSHPKSLPRNPPHNSLQVLSYNIHKGFSSGNRNFVLHQIREAIRTVRADLVFLQEVLGEHREHQRKYSAHWERDSQFEFLADEVWPHFAYGKNAIYTSGHHGNAILSRYPFTFFENIDISTNRMESAASFTGSSNSHMQESRSRYLRSSWAIRGRPRRTDEEALRSNRIPRSP